MAKVTNEKLGRDIYDLLSDGSELGVNEIARKLAKPVTTIQNYLVRYGTGTFRKTANRKWTVDSDLFTVDNWPGGINSEAERERLTLWIDNPVENMADIATHIRRLRESADRDSRRADFLFRITERELRKHV